MPCSWPSPSAHLAPSKPPRSTPTHYLRHYWQWNNTSSLDCSWFRDNGKRLENCPRISHSSKEQRNSRGSGAKALNMWDSKKLVTASWPTVKYSLVANIRGLYLVSLSKTAKSQQLSHFNSSTHMCLWSPYISSFPSTKSKELDKYIWHLALVSCAISCDEWKWWIK